MAFYYKSNYNSPLFSDMNLSGAIFLDVTLKGPLKTYGEEGEAGQVLTAQGGNVPPKWITPSGGGGSLPTLGTAGQLLRVNAGATDLEYFTPSYLSGITLGSTTLTSGTTGSVLFVGASGVIQQDNANFFWNDTTNRLGLGNSNPQALLHVSATNADIRYTQVTSTGNLVVRYDDNNTNQYPLAIENRNITAAIRGTGIQFNFADTTTTNTRVGGYINVNQEQDWTSTASTRDSAIVFSNSLDGNVVEKVRITSSGQIYLGTNPVVLGTTNSNVTYAQTVNGRGLILQTSLVSLTDTNATTIRDTGSSAASGSASTLAVVSSFNPISGTGVFNSANLNPTINQTGGANGITRGLYINPTLTAAADFRAIEISNNSGKAIYQTGASALNYFAGNVGIGTASPLTKLQVVNASTSGSSVAVSSDRYGLFIGTNETSVTGFGLNIVSGTNINTLVGGSTIFYVRNDGNIGIGTSSPDRLLQIEALDSVTNTVTYGQRLTHITSGTATTGFGVGREIELENGSGTNIIAAAEEYTWSDATNASEDATYRLRLVDNGILGTQFTISSIGVATFSNTAKAANFDAGSGVFYWSGKTQIACPLDGIVTLRNAANNDFYRLQFGGTTSSFPSIQRSSAGLIVRLADDSADADIRAGNVISTGIVRTRGYTVASLPAGTVGDRAYVTDATSPTYLGTLTGGGAVTCPVFYNGTAWVSA